MRGFQFNFVRLLAVCAACAFVVIGIPTTTNAADLPAVQLVINKGVDNPMPIPGQGVNYTIVLRNTGDAALQNVAITDDMTDSLDDASYLNNATDNGAGGTFTFNDPVLTWQGNVPAGGKPVIIKYGVVVNNPTTGNHVLVNKVQGPDISNCAASTTDKSCETTTPISLYSIDTNVSAPTVQPGNVLTFGVLLSNNSPADYLGASFTDDLSNILENATFNAGSQTDNGAAGTFDVKLPQLKWTGNVPAGKTIVINFSVTANKSIDNRNLVNMISSTPDTNCGPGSPDSGCRATSVVSTSSGATAASDVTHGPLAVTSVVDQTSTTTTAVPAATGTTKQPGTQVLGETLAKASSDPSSNLPNTGAHLIMPVNYAIILLAIGGFFIASAYMTRRHAYQGQHFRH